MMLLVEWLLSLVCNNLEFKTMIVEEYINGIDSAVNLVAKHKISSANILLRLVSLYNANRELKELQS